MTESRRPLVRPGFLKWSVVAFVLLIPVLAYNVWDYVEARRLNATIAALDRNGEPIRESYRLLKGPAAEADRTYRAAATLAEGLWTNMPAGFSFRLGDAERDENWPPDVVAQIRVLADRYREPVILAERAAALPFEGFAPGSENNGYRNSGMMGLARALGFDAAVRAFDGDAARALDALAAEARLEKFNPLFWLGRFATDLRIVTDRVRLSDGGLARLAAAVEDFDVDDRPKRELRRDRAEILRSWQLARNSSTVLGYRILPPWFAHDVNRQVAVFSKLLSAADGPWPQRIDRVVGVGEWPLRYEGSDHRAVLEEFMDSIAHNIAVARCIRTVVAIERFRRDHAEQVPDRLEQLVPRYLPAPTIDPYSGRPIVFAREPGGYVVYSIGTNRRDDGGRDVNSPYASSTAWPFRTYTNDVGVRIQYR